MAERNRGPFREKSLERLSSPERLDQLLRAVDRKSWLPLITLSVLVLLLLLWAVFGRVPIHVQGKGILIRPREVVEFQSPGSGYLARLNVRVGDEVEKGTVLAVIDRPDLQKQHELQTAKVRELTALSQAADILGPQGSGATDDQSTPRSQSLQDHIQASRALAEDLKEKGLQSVAQERERLQEQCNLAQKLADSLQTSREKQTELYESNVLAREELIETEESYTDSLARLSDLEAQMHELRTRELEIEEQYLNRLQRIADLTFELQGHEQQIADVYREIARLKTALEEETQVVSEHSGRVLEISAVVGEFLAPGDRLGSMALNDPSSPLRSLTYFTVRDGKRLEPGMRIQVTPDPVERARFGSIVGTIESISAFPVTRAEVESVVGNPGVAEALISGGHLIQVFAGLERDPSTPSGLRWSSSRGPDMLFSAGTTTTARAALDRRPPITFVLPFLKSAFGVD